MANSKRGILIAGNWKMFKTRADVETFFQDLEGKVQQIPDSVSVMICAGYTLLSTVSEAVKRRHLPILLSAQNMEAQAEGAYTGEVSPLQLKELEVNAVILGHSERRTYYNESNSSINLKGLTALNYEITPIMCVGETLEQREAGSTDEVIRFQINESLKGYNKEHALHIVIAYEPVWAIGTGKVCEAEEANRVCGLIRNELSLLFDAEVASHIQILYGGSMKPENAEELLQQPEIDGGLIGGASLTPDSFSQLVHIAVHVTNECQSHVTV